MWVGGVGGSLYGWEVDVEVVVSDVEGLGCFAVGIGVGGLSFVLGFGLA